MLNATRWKSVLRDVKMEGFKLTLDVEDIVVLNDTEIDSVAGGGAGTMTCTPPCATTVSSDCDTSGCKPTSRGCTQMVQ